MKSLEELKEIKNDIKNLDIDLTDQKVQKKVKNYSKYSLIALAIIIVALILVNTLTARKRFTKTSAAELEREANNMYLMFNAGLNREMGLALQMAKSPVIVSYMEDPENEEVAELAMEEIATYQDSFASHITFWIGDSDLKYYSNGDYIYTLDKSDPTSAWYNNCMAYYGDYELNVDYDIGLKVTNLWVNAIVRNSEGQSIGLIGTGISLSSFIDTMYSNLNPAYEMLIYNKLCEITGSTVISYLEDKTPITDVNADVKNIDLFPENLTVSSGKKADYAILPIDVLNWYIIIAKDYTVGSFLKTSTQFIILIVVIIIAFAIIITFSQLITPLSVLQGTVEGIANGNADLTQRIELSTKSSMKIIRKLVDSFNKFVSQLQSIIKNVKETKDELTLSGSELKDSTIDTSASITEIIANIQNFSQNLEHQSTGVEDTSLAIKSYSQIIETFGSLVDAQSTSVTQASAAIEQMVGNINSVNNSVEKLSSSFKTLEVNANAGVSQQEEVSNKINKIREQSEILQSANEIISSIAEETNLLAMNAAIEAAHAGDAGKGFSVVADEIRKLAETSSEQSNTIGMQLNTIQESIETIVAASSSSQETFHNVAEDIRTTNLLITEIYGAMEEQAAGSKQINNALSDLNSSMTEVRTAAVDISEGNKEIINQINELENATYSMKEGMTEMNIGAQKINETGANLSTISDRVDDSIKKIGDQIDQFKV